MLVQSSCDVGFMRRSQPKESGPVALLGRNTAVPAPTRLGSRWEREHPYRPAHYSPLQPQHIDWSFEPDTQVCRVSGCVIVLVEKSTIVLVRHPTNEHRCCAVWIGCEGSEANTEKIRKK